MMLAEIFGTVFALKLVVFLVVAAVLIMLLYITQMNSTIEELKMFVWSLLPDEPRAILERDYWSKEVKREHGE